MNRLTLFFADDILADESDGVEISRFFSYVEEMKKNKNSGFQNEFKVITFRSFFHRKYEILVLLRKDLNLVNIRSYTYNQNDKQNTLPRAKAVR